MMKLWDKLKDWFAGLSAPGEEYTAVVVSRDTYEKYDIGMLYRGCFVVNGFRDGDFYVLVLRGDILW